MSPVCFRTPHDSQTPPQHTHTLLTLKSRVSMGHEQLGKQACQLPPHWSGQCPSPHGQSCPPPPATLMPAPSQPSSVLRAEFPMFTQKRLKQVHHRWTRNGHKHPGTSSDPNVGSMKEPTLVHSRSSLERPMASLLISFVPQAWSLCRRCARGHLPDLGPSSFISFQQDAPAHLTLCPNQLQLTEQTLLLTACRRAWIPRPHKTLHPEQNLAVHGKVQRQTTYNTPSIKNWVTAYIT